VLHQCLQQWSLRLRPARFRLPNQRRLLPGVEHGSVRHERPLL
jgi:hypothetical protein